MCYLCDSQDAYIWTGGSRAISCPEKTIQHTGNAFYKYSPAETKKHHNYSSDQTVNCLGCLWRTTEVWEQIREVEKQRLPVDGVDGRRRSTRQPSAGVVISNWLDDAGHHSAHHTDHTCSRHRGNAPLDCRGKTCWYFYPSSCLMPTLNFHIIFL